MVLWRCRGGELKVMIRVGKTAEIKVVSLEGSTALEGGGSLTKNKGSSSSVNFTQCSFNRAVVASRNASVASLQARHSESGWSGRGRVAEAGDTTYAQTSL